MRRTALITGGSRGIGLGIARELAQNNFDLAINGTRAADEVENVLQELRNFSADIIYCQGNISSASDRKNILQQVANWMIEQKKIDNEFKGCIINISSISATVVSVNRGEYCISKAGLGMATQLFATRLGEFDIPVFEVRPGIIHSDMTTGVKEKYDKLIGAGLCVQKRWGEPEDVGKVVASLAKGDFMYSTGQVIMVDGGLTIPRL